MIDLATIITAICARAGISAGNIDVTELSTIFVEGYNIGRLTDGSNAIKPLRLCGLFDIIERDRKIYFKVRGGAPVATITAAQLGARQSGEAIIPAVTTLKAQDFELPRQVRFNYISKTRDYERSEQLSPARFGTPGVNDATVECAVVLTDDRAAQLAEISFREAWASRVSHEISVDQSLTALEPGDVLLIPVDGRQYRVRIVHIDDSQMTRRKLYLSRDDDGSYVSTAIATIPKREAPVIVLPGEAEAAFLDLPALNDAHDEAGFYGAAHRVDTAQSWVGATLFRSIDAGASHQNIAGLAAEATFGSVVTAPSTGNVYTWDDTQSYVIELENGALVSRTNLALDAGANCAAVGVHGRWHLFQFGTVTALGGGQYRLSHLLLGRRGTEHLLSTVVPGDRFVLVSGSGVYRLPLQNSEIGASRLYRTASAGQNFDDVVDVPFTGAGQALECFSPVAVDGSRDGSSNLTITWIRRDRLSITLPDGVAVPNSEVSQAYEVDIMNGASVVRTISGITSPTTSYSAANQTTDFGSPQASITVRVYQLSAVVGRGTKAEAIV